MPTSQGRSSVGVASMGGLPSGRSVPARTSTVRVPAPVSHARSTPSRTATPRRSSACTSAGSRSEGAITTTTWESAREAKAPSASNRSGCWSMTPVGSSGHPGATRRPQTMTMPGPCHSSSRRAMSRQAARELSVGSGGRSRSPMTSTRRPSATGSVRSVPPAVAGSLSTPVSASDPISRPSCHLRGPRLLRNWEDSPLPGRARPLGWSFVPETKPEDDRINWTWRAEGAAPHPGGPAVIFDIDGVLSDAAGRQHFLERGRRDWASFFEACGDDPVIEEIARLLELLDPSLAVILLTGRPHRVHPQTLAWLKRYGLRWDLLVMRSRGDYAQVTEFKQSVVEDLGRTASTCGSPSRTIRPTTPCTWRPACRASTSTRVTTSSAAGGPTRRRAPARRAPAPGGRPSGRTA